MRRIFLDVVGRRHSLYDELLDYPPEGYEFVTDKSSWSVLSEASCRTDTMGRIPRQFLRSLLPLNLAKSYLERFKSVAEDTYMTYSSGHLVFRNEPWVVDLEYVTHLSDYSLSHFNTFRGIIESELRSENCKRIMPWTDSGRDTILSMIHDDRICEKVETVRLAVRGKDFRRQYGKDRVRFLFVGSANMPRAFDIKGGKEVIEAFLQLTQRYKNLELVVRSYVPSKLKEKLASIGNIRIIDRIVPFEVLESEFQSADIFLFPSHNTPGMVLLDAMSYELPVITTDVWANSEMVFDGRTGFLVPKSKLVDYYVDEFIPNWSSGRSLKAITRKTDGEVVKSLVEKASALVEDEELRRRMGRAGRYEIEEGRFSIQTRNNKLKKIFDSCA